MPKSQVRQAIATYLAPNSSQIAYLGVVYQSLPKVANEADLFLLQPPGTGLGAAIWFFIDRQDETRIGIGGQYSGKKLRTYSAALLCVLKSDLRTTLEGQVAFDEFIDSLTACIEADRQAGAPGVIFGWGEGGENGGPDLNFEFYVPKTLDGGVSLFQALGRVTVLEVLTT